MYIFIGQKQEGVKLDSKFSELKAFGGITFLLDR